MVLDLLLENIDDILGRITTSHLHRYDTLETELRTKSVDSDQWYQRLFNGFCRMQRRTEGCYRYYFSLLEREKHNRSITFAQILERIYFDKSRVDPSFSSKMVATLRPEMPVYD